MDESTPVSRALMALHIPHRVFRHAGPVHSLEQAARERGQTPEQVVRSIVFRVAQGEYVMVLIAGRRQVSWPAVRRYLGQSRMTMASEAEVLTATGYQRGAVSPVGLPAPMRILVDERVMEQTEISVGSGERGVTIILNPEDLKRAIGEIEIGAYAEK
jgi:Cys-tRNA(Pro) deacylase